MLKRLSFASATLLLFLGLCLAVPAGSARADSLVRLLAMDAGMAFAQALRAEDPKQRAALLDQAQAKIDQIMAEFPDSAEAQRLRADEKLVGVSPSILAAARRAVRATLEQGGELPPGERDRCLTRPTMSCLFDLAGVTARHVENKASRITQLAEIAEARARAGEMEKAYAIARPLAYGRASGPGTRAVTEIAALQALAGHLDLALVTAKNLDSRAARGHALARIVEALAADGQVQAAHGVAESIEHQSSRIRAQVAVALADRGPVEAAEFVEEAIDRAHRLPERQESDTALEAIVESLVGAGDLERAILAARQIIDPVRVQRVGALLALRLAESVALEPAIKVARELGGTTGAPALLVRLAEERLEARDLAAVAEIIRELDTATPRGRILDKVAAVRLSAEQAGVLAEAAAALEDRGLRARALAIAARSLAAAGAAKAAARLRDEVLAQLGELDEWRRTPALLELAATEVWLERAPEALDQLAAVPAGGLWYDQAQGLATALAATGSAEPAQAAAERLVDEGDRERLLLAAALALAEAGHIPPAMTLAEAINSDERRDHALFGIAKAELAATGDPAVALTILEQATGVQKDDNLLREFAAAQVEAGDLLGALRTAERIERPGPKAAVYMDLARRLRSPLALQ